MLDDQDDQYEGESDSEYSDRLFREGRAQYRATFPGNWVQRWRRDEAFWRAITINVLSGLILAFLVYFLAVLAGLVKPWLLAVLGTILVLLLGLSMTGFRLDAARGRVWNGKLNVWKFIRGELEVVVVVVVLLAVIWGGAWLLGLVWH